MNKQKLSQETLQQLYDEINSDTTVILPKGCTVEEKDGVVTLKDKDGVARIMMPIELFKDICNWKEEKDK